ncbi:hypothetical protein ABT104_12145 [Streptomyces mobaraensis]|uniref:hypothetical protein n=1 Tax=Streptomyces mobaraensis TaxID=35621 RepID=UPI00331B8B13
MADVTNEQVLTEVKNLDKSLTEQIKDLKKSLSEPKKESGKPSETAKGDKGGAKEEKGGEEKKEEEPPGWLEYIGQMTGLKDQIAAFKTDFWLGVATVVTVTGLLKIDYEKFFKQAIKKGSGGRRELETNDWGLPKLKRPTPEPPAPPVPTTGENRITSTQLTQAHTAADQLSASLRQLAAVMEEAERAASGLT